MTGQWNFINNVLSSATVGKGKNRYFGGWMLFKIRSHRTFKDARIEFDQMIEPCLAAMRTQPVLVTEECAVLIVRLCATGQQTQN